MKPRELVAELIEDMHQRHRTERKRNARTSYEALTGWCAPDKANYGLLDLTDIISTNLNGKPAAMRPAPDKSWIEMQSVRR